MGIPTHRRVMILVLAATLLAVAVPLVLSSIADQRLSAALDSMTVEFSQWQMLSQSLVPPGMVFRLTLTISNDGPVRVETATTGQRASIGGIGVMPTHLVGARPVDPGESADIWCDITITESQLNRLRGLGQTELVLDMTASYKARIWRWERTASEAVQVTHRMLFD